MNLKLWLRRYGSAFLLRSGLLWPLASRAENWRILMYHRVCDPAYFLQPGMYVKPESFRRHMQHLSKHANVIDLDSLVLKILNKEEISKKTVAISFDDGWRDNYQYAFPVLKELELPATVFLATEYIDSDSTFWSDAMCFAVSRLREKNFDPEHLGQLAVVHELPTALFNDFLLTLSASQSEVLARIDALIWAMKELPQDTREGFAQAVLAEVGGKNDRSFLSWEEVREMGACKITFASHTHSHTPLSELSKEKIELELARSKEQLQANQARLAGTFCYPEGRYSALSQETLADIGILASLAVERESKLDEKPALIGRIGVHEDITSTEAMFAARLWL